MVPLVKDSSPFGHAIDYFSGFRKKNGFMRVAREIPKFHNLSLPIIVAAVTWLEYFDTA